jgi:ClpP class serine protease
MRVAVRRLWTWFLWIGFCFFSIIAVAAPVAEKAAPAEKRAETKPARKAVAEVIAHIALEGSLPDGVGQPGLLADVKPHLHRLVERIDRAAGDPKVKGVLLAIASPELGRARLEELRAAIGRVRAAGKPVANRVEPGKRPRSSMAPVMVARFAGLTDRMMIGEVRPAKRPLLL